MEWAVTLKQQKVGNHLIKDQGYTNLLQKGDFNQLQLLMNNWTDGMADKTISYEVINGPDAWRKLHWQQLPTIEHQKQLLMIEFNGLQIAQDRQELKYVMQELDRITSQHRKMSSQNFDEETKLAKLKVLIPTDVYKFIAVA